MSTFDLISLAVAVGAVLVSVVAVFFSGVQTKRSTETLVLGQQISRGEAIMHFTEAYFDLAREGKPTDRAVDPRWAYRFWSLHTTEFYFFHHGILPVFMYSLWVMYLAQLYCGANAETVWESHKQYLDLYSFNYPEMTRFFSEVYGICNLCDDEELRNRRISDFVTSWISENRRTLLT